MWKVFCACVRGSGCVRAVPPCSVCSSSFTCGLAGAIASNPVDVVRTRMMNQRAIVGSTELYKGTLDGLVKVRAQLARALAWEGGQVSAPR